MSWPPFVDLITGPAAATLRRVCTTRFVQAGLAALALVLAVLILAPPPSRAQAPARVFLPLGLASAHLDALPAPATAEPEPSATVPPPTPTAEPTTPPSPSPIPTQTVAPATPTATAQPPTATATPALVCENILANGDFERGARDWTLIVTSREQNLALALLRRAESPVAPHGGEHLAFLGGADETTFTLHSKRLPRFDPESIERATLRYWSTLLTEEQPDRRAGDRLRAYVDAVRRTYVPEMEHSEETLRPAGTWHEVSADVTPMLARGVDHVGVEVVTDRRNRSWFYLDDVAFEICRRP